MELNREHFRALIYFNFQRQLSQQECLAELLSVFGNEAPHQSTIYRWCGERIILHQDNASSHAAQKTRHPNLSPNDFFTFPRIKNRLRGQRFQPPEAASFENWFERMQMY
ncbi:unnamed protein product [Acanthoscelides obtectus]|uniref:Mos1 transposase HTH domain-containing protein n=1 Tax=Acanthoscelides obtectus TaxID=200917 RepID=A0A9P0NRT6_ACAOB|nr:unnamed protein product [Acanthoscelides obtectus]CAK1661050.1 hypothetical protein AOBTE_LOCUS22398 [Acanthoscelides obtectus]